VSVLTFDTLQRTPAQVKPTAIPEQLCLKSAQLWDFSNAISFG
jgi:hypothetical protein